MPLNLSTSQSVEIDDSLSDINMLAKKAHYVSKSLWQRISSTYPCASLRATTEFYQDSETAANIVLDFILQMQSMIEELQQRIQSESEQ